jgi:hypothetical protein
MLVRINPKSARRRLVHRLHIGDCAGRQYADRTPAITAAASQQIAIKLDIAILLKHSGNYIDFT